MASAEILDEGMASDYYPGVGLEPTHRAQPPFQLPMVSFHPVVGIPLGATVRGGQL